MPGGAEALQAWLSGDLRPTQAGYNAIRVEIMIEDDPGNAEAIRQMTPAQLWDYSASRFPEDEPWPMERIVKIIGPRPAEDVLA